MKKFLFMSVLVALGPSLVLAQGQAMVWRCSVDGLERLVELNEAMTGAPVCDVWYDKSAEGGAKMRLWAADNDGAYCRPKAEQLVVSLESWGWVCAVQLPPETP